MKKVILLFGFLCLAGFSQMSAAGNNKTDELLKKSDLPAGTYPAPFTITAANPITSPAISTGYYFVDSREINLPEFWRVNQEIVPLDFEPELWKRILSGPRQVDSTYWNIHKSEGLAFFRNPAKPSTNSYFKHNVSYAIDSTNDAIAGPIPLGLAGGFYFSGIRYDSFYVSTNGVIALTNRRYFYDAEGNRAIPPGATDAYDPMSMDWVFAGTGVNSRARKAGALSLTDPIADDFGYKYAVLGNPSNVATNGGIRANGVNPFQADPGNGLQGFDAGNKCPLIAPFWGAMQFMQYDQRWAHTAIDYSQVWYKRSSSADKLIIYIIQIQPEGSTQAHQFAGSSFIAPDNGVVGRDANYVDASAQVVLNRLDSSITIQYDRFRGSAKLANNATYTAAQVMQGITLSGVRGFGRHVNFDGTTAGPVVEYEQVTHFNKRVDPRSTANYADRIGVKFKQYKNVLRVHDTKYKVRNPINTTDMTFNTLVASPANYELLAGDARLGAIQPIATIQNLTNNIQGLNGVNYTPQQLQFRTRIRIKNDVTGDIVYSTLMPISDSTLRSTQTDLIFGEKVRWFDPFANGGAGAEKAYIPTTNHGIPPYDFAQVTFRPFAPSELESRFIGRLSVSVMAEPVDPVTKEALGDQWPFDDTSNTRLWVMKRISNFKDDVTEFHFLDNATVPSVLKWVNLGATAISADDNSMYPLAPRGRYQEATKNDQLGAFLNSPAILMDRVNDESKADWVINNDPTIQAGDELRSFPIDLNGKINPVLSLSIQRSVQNRTTTARGRGFCDQTLYGPEPRVVINDDNRTYPEFKGTTSPYGGATYLSRFKNDEIRIEFAYPSDDGVKNVTNMTDDNWRKYGDLNGGTQSSISAYALYGGGGYRLGFDKVNIDDALTETEGLRIDPYDDGFDWDYKKIFIPIPGYITNAPETQKKNFRFRLQVKAINHYTAHQSINIQTIQDDNDPFIIDNISIISNPREADLEVASVKVKWPYTAIPASQALNVPISVKISNNTSTNSKSFVLRTFVTDPQGDTVYCRNVNIPTLAGGIDTLQEMPAWNARSNRPGKYRIHARMHYVGNTTNMMDIDTTNDYNYSDFDLTFAESFTYEKDVDPTMATNDVPKFLNTPNRGLNIRAYRLGGFGTNTAWNSDVLLSDLVHQAGALGGDASGQIAAKFTLSQPDTIYGYQAFFASYNMDQSHIMFRIYNSSPDGSLPTNTVVAGSEIIKTRAVDDITGQFNINKYVTYKLATPLLLPSGTYWVTIGQLGTNGLELGAKAERMGIRTMATFADALTQELGNNCVNLLVDKSLRQLNSYGNLVNNNIFAFENIIGTNEWQPFMSSNSNPAYPHLDHYGLSPNDGKTFTMTRGTWLPMLRPYFGVKDYGKESVSIPCPEPTGLPVEVTEFNAQSRNNGIEVFWATATEINNKGFYVEKAVDGSLDFKAITFVEGKGNSVVANQYSHFDKDVESNKTYTYRLRQVDYDGSNCDTYSQEVKVKFTYDGDVVLEANAPNPFATSTKISFRLAEQSDVKLEVLDMFGSVIRTLANGNFKAERYSFEWTGVTESGSTVAPGTYVYRLTVGDKVLHGKMTIVR